MSIPPDAERCQYTTSDGKRCRSVRLKGDHTLCFFHFSRAQNKTIEPHPAFVAAEILPPEMALDSPRAVNDALTRIFRAVLEGRLPPRHANTLTYVVQSVLPTLPHLQREAVPAPTHELLGANPDATLAELAQVLRKSAGGNGKG